MIKFKVLLSSFLMQSSSLQRRLERKGDGNGNRYSHDEVYWRKRSKVGYKIAKRVCDTLVDAKRINLHSTPRITLCDGYSNCIGYLIADHFLDLDDGLGFQSTDLVYVISSSATKKKLIVKYVDERVRST